VQLPLNIYACVRGECGDGACEIGEADHCGCAADCSDSAPGDGDAGMPVADPAWITITSECGFTLRAPPDLVEFKVQGTDSCVVSYQANGCNYDGDYGFYSGALDSASSQPGYHSQSALIDGQSASVVTYGLLDSAPRWVAGVHFPALPAGASVKFTLLALCDTAAEQSVALQVFDTLRFAR
jgi:hypothetical protein